MTPDTPIPPVFSDTPPFPVWEYPAGGQNASNAAQSGKKHALVNARQAEKQRIRAARYRARPGVRAKEAARLRAWRAGRRAFLARLADDGGAAL